jgi:hypothetical protein
MPVSFLVDWIEYAEHKDGDGHFIGQITKLFRGRDPQKR